VVCHGGGVVGHGDGVIYDMKHDDMMSDIKLVATCWTVPCLHESCIASS